MPSFFELLRSNVAYFFILVGVIWLAVAVLGDTVLLAWPVVACFASGALLKLVPGNRFTWAWVLSTAVLGFLISIYQVYAWAPLVGGAFSTLAGSTVAAFLVLAAVHVLLFYSGATGPNITR